MFIAMNGGQKPSGCKTNKTQTACQETSFECYRMGFCDFSVAGNCVDSATFGGPAKQVTKKVSRACGTVAADPTTPSDTTIAE